MPEVCKNLCPPTLSKHIDVMTITTIQGILVLPIFVPLIVGLVKRKSADRVAQLFIFFLLAGLATDVVMWVLFYMRKPERLLIIFNFYSLVEAIFFFWFLYATSLSNAIRKVSYFFLLATLPFWIFCIFIYPAMVEKALQSAVFDTTYEVIVSFLAGYALLLRVEKETPFFSSSVVWFTLGIFFYCFCTFYIMTFLQTFVSHQIWFLNNIFNIISYALYTLGFWYIKTKPASP